MHLGVCRNEEQQPLHGAAPADAGVAVVASTAALEEIPPPAEKDKL
jgi:hypothetical protein